jgi:TolB-like protein/Tfp pilus assembly protein PilF
MSEAMVDEQSSDVKLEIGHVLFIDIVGYSKQTLDEQKALVTRLNELVRNAPQFRSADATGKLIRIPTGDGMALAFFTSPDAPVNCAIELAKANQADRKLELRMGIHSGPVDRLADVNERTNLAGAGMNMALRVMDCGDAGHILLSKHVAEDLENYEHWRPLLHDIGTFKVKHGVQVSVTNLCSDEVGNPQLPSKLLAVKKHRAHVRWAEVAIGLLVFGAIIAGVFFIRPPTTSPVRVLDKSIAILPFENLSNDKENAYFTDGVQDEILTHLAKVADLKVISRASVMQYKSGVTRNLRKIGEELGVAHVVEGNVQRAGNKVRVNAQLIDARSDKHLWAQTYDRDLADVFAIQSEIAQKIADQLEAKISPREKAAIEEQPTKDIAAYDLYVRATVLIDKAVYEGEQPKDYFQAVDLLNQAVARDPGFLLAYCRLAEAHDELYYRSIDRTNRLTLAKAAIDSAFHLKPDSGEAHLALASHLYHGYFDYDGARDQLAIALRTLPNNALIFEWNGYIDRRQGRWHDAMRNFERAMELDPRNARIVTDAAITYALMRDYRQAATTIERLIALEPKTIGHRELLAWLDASERVDIRALRALVEKTANDPALLRTLSGKMFFLSIFLRDPIAADRALEAITDNTFGVRGGAVQFTRAYSEGLVARLKGDEDGARAAFSAARAELEKVVRAERDDRTESSALCSLGLIDAALGRKQEALSEGRRGVELMPITKDALNGTDISYFYAAICAQVGERDLAIEQLKTLAKIPAGASYMDLRLDPFWDPLRGDTRFEKIVQSLAPKE